ncbi:hypothetical protein [Microcoleus anatoxicus]|uniref:hypothetical protein n=1 Tax=Microcoleus anatoxicus TaxID=2705319 RepID=UPI00366F6A34
MSRPSDLLASENITFEGAIALTQSLLSEIEADRLSQAQIQQAVASLVNTHNGARGFFVTYLTDDRHLADEPSPGVLDALREAPEIVAELLPEMSKIWRCRRPWLSITRAITSRKWPRVHREYKGDRAI